MQISDSIEASSDAKLSRVIFEKEFIILILCAFVFFFEPLFLGKTFFFRDFSLHFLPQKQLFADLVKAGELPLWDPYSQGGQPLLANSDNIILYPTNILYLFLPLLTAFNWEIVLNFALSVASAYLLARVLGISSICSMIASIAYAFCGYHLSLMNIWFYQTFHQPLILLTWHLYLQQNKTKYFLLSALLGAVQVLAGRPESPAITLPVILLWAFAYPYGLKATRVFKQWLILSIFIIGLAAVQLIPMAEMLSNSTRRYSTPFTFSSLSPKRLPELVIPQFLGDTCTISNAEFWGRKLEDMDPPLFLSIYCGVPVLLLTLAGGITRRNLIIPRKARLLLLILFIGSIFLSLEKNLPFFEILSRVPVVGLFRFPEKLLLVGILPMALLASAAADEYFRRSSSVNSRLPIAVLCCVVPIAALLISFFFSTRLAESFQNFFFGEGGPNISAKLPFHFLHASLVGLSLVFLLIIRRKRPASWQAVALVVVIAIDLLRTGSFVNRFAPREFWMSTPGLTSIVKNELEGGKLYREETYDRVLRAPSSDIFWDSKWNFEVLNYYTPTFYRIPRIFHPDIDQMGAVQMQNLSNALHALPWDRRYPILRTAGVSLLLTHEELDSLDVQKITAVRNDSNFVFHLYRNPGFLPEASFVTQSRVVETRLEAIKVMADQTFDPHSSVVLFGKEAESSTASCGKPTIQHEFAGAQSSSFQIEAPCNGFLVLTTPFYPGWKLTIDGKRTEILRANYAFTAARMEKGSHRVVTRYSPASVFIGILTSACFFIALLIWRKIS